MKEYVIREKNVRIVADSIEIDEAVEFGNNVNINLRGKFQIGKYSRLGDDARIAGNNAIFGRDLFNSSGLTIGGGGRQHPNANFKIGDRCTIHNNFINVCEDIEIGDDVGLSPETSILSHGYWLSVLEGYPAAFAGVKIGNGVIIGYRSLVMMGVSIADCCVIGAQSVVTRTIDKKGIYAGSPARFIKEIVPLDPEKRIAKIEAILAEYDKIVKYHGIAPRINLDYPKIKIDDFEIDVETFEYSGSENDRTDDFRDYIRKWGIRIYTGRPFKSVF